MDITVSGRHVAVSPALRQAVTEKIGRLDRFLDGILRAEVHFTEERNPRITDREVCEVTLEGPRHSVRAKAAASDHFAAIDLAVSKLEHQLTKLNKKLVGRSHPRPSRAAAAAAATTANPGAAEAELDLPLESLDGSDEDEEATGTGPRVVKTKRFTMKPMTVDEAALQMDLLGHSFFFFSNADSGRAAVLYRRSDGDLGLIEAG